VKLKASIFLKDNFFIIKSEKKFPSFIIYTIDFFGFKNYSENNEEYNIDKEKIDIRNVISFLEQNDVELSLCEKTIDIINTAKKYEINFIEEKNTLKEIKNNPAGEDYENFSVFTDKLKRKLKKHQNESAFHLYKSKSAANLSVPGSGKTSVVLAYYEKLKSEKKVDAIFVIGPKNSFDTWDDEFYETLGRKSNITVLGPILEKREGTYHRLLKNELYVCGFQIVATDIDYLKKFFTHNKFLLVIDEAHYIKKIDGKWANAALELSKFSEYKVILTGTPMPNAFRDYFNYVDFLYGKDEIITKKEKSQIEIYMDQGKKDEAIVLLKEKIFPFYKRVTKKDLKLSKQNFIKPLLIKMNPIENEIHQAILTRIRYFKKKDYLKNIELMESIHKARVIRLMQACSYVKALIKAIPAEYNIENENENLVDDIDIQKLIRTYDENEKPAKLLKLKHLVKELVSNKKKVLIWSTHRATIDLVFNELKIERINIKQITGSTEDDERKIIKREFNNPSSTLQAIIATPQSSAESISLHKDCQNAIYYDLNFNAAQFIQSLDRIHRVGGSEEKEVNYNFLHYEDSIDIKIYKRVFEKADLQMQVIEDDNSIFSIPDEDEKYADLYT
jgi:hypothetical protein